MPAGRLLVVEKGQGTLGVIDLERGERIAGIPASGAVPHEVAASSDGATALLPVYGDANVGQPGTDGRVVDVVDLRRMAVARTVHLEAPTRPHDAALGADGRVYVTGELRQQVLVLDATTGERLAVLPTGREQSHMVALTSDARRAATVNVGPGSVSVIDVATGEVERVVELGTRVNRVAITPDDRFIITADQAAPRLAFIDTVDGSVSWVPLPAVGYSTAPTADGRLLVTLRPTDELAVLELASREVERVLAVPATPQRVIARDGLGYVSCDRSDVVLELDPASGAILREFPTGSGPDGLAWAPTPA